MSHIKIRGGHSLHGEIEVQGAKNAALPIIAASVLNNGTVHLRRCPQIMDVHHMLRILQQSGAGIMWDDGDVWIKTDQMDTVAVSSLDAGKMRSSIIRLGALLGRGQEVTMPYPGGCTIGARPIDWHIDALRKMNVQIDLKENKIECKTTGLKGNRIELPYPSVGVTENILLAAVLADGVTEIIHAAMEPEIADLCRFLKKSGACIEGEGTERIRIKGVKTLHDTEYTIMADRIAAGTYMAAAAAVGGEIVLKGIHIENVRAVADVLVESGCGLIIYKESIKIIAPSMLLAVKEIETEPYPGFPTDMQSQMLACLCQARGDSTVTEHIFENRYKVVPELIRMGGNITVDQRRAVIHGPCRMHGEKVEAKELRGGAALVIAGLAAEGETVIHGSEHIERGYQDICRDLGQLGAEICCITDHTERRWEDN